MRAACMFTFGLVAVFAIAAGTRAEEKNKGDTKTLKGTITCAKCDLKVEGVTKCATVIKVDEDGKDVIYYFAQTSHKKFHDDICTSPKKGTVKGKVSEKDGRKWVEADSVEYDKD